MGERGVNVDHTTLNRWVIDYSQLTLAGLIIFVEIRQVKYLNNLIEQDHRFMSSSPPAAAPVSSTVIISSHSMIFLSSAKI